MVTLFITGFISINLNRYDKVVVSSFWWYSFVAEKSVLWTVEWNLIVSIILLYNDRSTPRCEDNISCKWITNLIPEGGLMLRWIKEVDVTVVVSHALSICSLFEGSKSQLMSTSRSLVDAK